MKGGEGSREQYKQEVTCSNGSENKVRITAGPEKVIIPGTLIFSFFSVIYGMRCTLTLMYCYGWHQSGLPTKELSPLRFSIL